jgi:repressor LexA
MQQLDEDLLSRIAEYIVSYQKRNGRSPGQRDIAAECKINSKRTYKYVHILTNRGLIELNGNGTIAIAYNLVPSDMKAVPLIDAGKCGQSTLAIEDYERMFQLPKDFTGEGDFFILIAEGDSMIKAGILAGDYLVIRKQKTAESGDIVMACKIGVYDSGEEAALKRYLIRNGKPILSHENEAYEEIDAKKYRIIGKLKSVIRKI